MISNYLCPSGRTQKYLYIYVPQRAITFVNNFTEFLRNFHYLYIDIR